MWETTNWFKLIFMSWATQKIYLYRKLDSNILTSIQTLFSHS